MKNCCHLRIFDSGHTFSAGYRVAPKVVVGNWLARWSVSARIRCDPLSVGFFKFQSPSEALDYAAVRIRSVRSSQLILVPVWRDHVSQSLEDCLREEETVSLLRNTPFSRQVLKCLSFWLFWSSLTATFTKTNHSRVWVQSSRALRSHTMPLFVMEVVLDWDPFILNALPWHLLMLCV